MRQIITWCDSHFSWLSTIFSRYNSSCRTYFRERCFLTILDIRFWMRKGQWMGFISEQFKPIKLILCLAHVSIDFLECIFRQWDHVMWATLLESQRAVDASNGPVEHAQLVQINLWWGWLTGNGRQTMNPARTKNYTRVRHLVHIFSWHSFSSTRGIHPEGWRGTWPLNIILSPLELSKRLTNRASPPLNDQYTTSFATPPPPPPPLPPW